jgi:hypothetical protein
MSKKAVELLWQTSTPYQNEGKECRMVCNAEIYKADPNENLFRQSRGMSPNPNEMPWPDPSEKDVVYLAWSNYTKGYAAGWAAAKAEKQ